ncbi:MAG: hypothetical protein GC146_12295 [Limimaricola sp.]|uniref:TfoX/Sxy family protein n=1 Tax=Limimaricola sp. TaxID=2211665 RepID=UPI001D32AF05|nr:TfoX/Sxy family protein [Limimaricola sp.]MBI1417993.1 hypothetical protein [Limimaricola sp.]
MAFDAGLVELIRGDLAEVEGITEKRMFGGICFLQHGNMLCGVSAQGAMFRVGKDSEAAARAIPGTGPMQFTGRSMAGFVDADDDLMADDARRGRVMALALAYLATLPPK